MGVSRPIVLRTQSLLKGNITPKSHLSLVTSLPLKPFLFLIPYMGNGTLDRSNMPWYIVLIKSDQAANKYLKRLGSSLCLCHSVSVCLCVHLYVLCCGGQRTNLGVVAQWLPTFWERISLLSTAHSLDYKCRTLRTLFKKLVHGDHFQALTCFFFFEEGK